MNAPSTLADKISEVLEGAYLGDGRYALTEDVITCIIGHVSEAIESAAHERRAADHRAALNYRRASRPDAAGVSLAPRGDRHAR